MTEILSCRARGTDADYTYAPSHFRRMSDFRKLHVWRKAHGLALNVHRVAVGIRGSTYASLRSQMIRSSMSIPANIVEGRGQKSGREFVRFLGYSVQSSRELDYHLIVARDIRAISHNDFTSLSDQNVEVRRMFYGLTKRVASSAVDHSPQKSVPTS